ncbi:creatininase family protein [Thioalkalivibrio sp. ALJ16]|uniref:creatininase family protein n=1 Tax=Thioalkalivibrio sp. ALJ16 TaxID=1158762 RepID=UPI00036C8264|nr:creatininase family protein [Thioalkalivibrio sp. ALJ16]
MDTHALPWWQNLTSREIAAHAERDAVAILPLSAIEQHGPHLPLDTDYRIGLGLLAAAHARLGEEPSRLILPPMCVATSTEHSGFPGTLTLRPETALETLRDLGHSVARSGFRRLLLVNSHGGNTAICDLAALDLRQQAGMLVAKHHYFRQPLPDSLGIPLEEQRHGLHGGLVETAMMLTLAPEQVRLDAATSAASLGATLADELELLEPEGRVAFAWMAGDLNPTGVVGDAGAASAELGRALVSHYAESVTAAIRDTARFDLGRLVP